jgi:UDP-N-acetylglucosamine:LPS N-acetylglucosamine transferase
VQSLLESPEKRDTMRAAMAQLGRPDASVQIAAVIRSLAAGGAQGEEIA